jgi:pilus assembly protein CpaB
MRTSTIISILVALVVAIAAVALSASYLQGEREAAIRQAQHDVEEQQPQKMIVVAAKNIAFGEKITNKNIRLEPWFSQQTPDGLFTTVEELISNEGDASAARHAMTSFQAGEPIHASRVTKAGEIAKLSAAIQPGFKAVSIRVNDVLGVAGFVLPGDHVDVLLTRNEKDQAYVDVLLQSVKVLAIDQQSDNRTDQPSVVRTVTFEVNTRDAQKLTLGASVGVLSLTLRNIESTGAERNKRISMNLLGSTHQTSTVANKPRTNTDSKTASQTTTQKPVKTTSVEPKYDVIGVIRGRGEQHNYQVIANSSIQY